MAIIKQNFHLTIRDIDVNTNLTNKAILAFFEDIAGYHSDLLGYGLKDIEKSRISWVLLNWKVKVLKPIKYGDSPEIQIVTWSRGVKLACTMRDFEIYDSTGDLCVIGSSKWTLIHLEKGLLRITEDMIKKYEPEEKSVFGDYDFPRIREPKEYISCYNYQVLRKDIDVNSHMHNLCYLDLAYESLPKEVYENNTFNDFEIMYKTPALLYDNLKCYYSFENNEHIVTIKSEDNKNLHAIIKLY